MDPAGAPLRRAPEWRLPALAGATAGLAFSPFLDPGNPAAGLLALPAAAALAATRPARGSAHRPAGSSVWVWTALVALVACAAGGGLGGARLGAIDAGAFD